MTGIDDIRVGQDLPPLDVEITARHVIMGAAASRDWQPQHHDHGHAIRAGLPGIILNTPTQAAWLSRYVTNWAGPRARVGRLKVRMIKPISPGDRIAIGGHIEAVVEAPAGWRWLRLALPITCAGEIVTDAAMLLAVPGTAEPWRAGPETWHIAGWDLAPDDLEGNKSVSMVEPIDKKVGRGRPRSVESEEAILDATMLILAEDGYAGLTTDKIAARARASKSTIYRRWPSKEHMVLAAVDRTPPLAPADSGVVLDDLLDVVMQFVGFLHDTPLGGALPALMAERAHNPSLAVALDPFVARRREPIKTILRRGIARSQLPSEIDLDLAVDLIMGPITLRTMFTPGDVREVAVRELLTVVLRGLRGAEL